MSTILNIIWKLFSWGLLNQYILTNICFVSLYDSFLNGKVKTFSPKKGKILLLMQLISLSIVSCFITIHCLSLLSSSIVSCSLECYYAISQISMYMFTWMDRQINRQILLQSYFPVFRKTKNPLYKGQKLWHSSKMVYHLCIVLSAILKVDISHEFILFLF